MTLPNKPKRFALLVWLAGLVLSGLLAWWVHASNQLLYADRLAKLTDDMVQLVERSFGLYEYGLRGARGAVVAAGGAAISRQVFASYMDTRDIAREFPGTRGFGFIRRVSRADETMFITMARADGAADFNIRELAAHSGDRFVIHYIYPVDGNRGATGLDVASEPNRRDAALAAARLGRVQLTAPITLVQAGAQPRRGFLAFLPVYRAGEALHTPEAREAAVVGWTYAPLVVDDVLSGFGSGLQEIGIRLTDHGEKLPFFDSSPASGSQPLPSVSETVRELTIFGRRWQLHAQALGPLAAAARPVSVPWVGGTAALVSSGLALLVWAVMTQRSQRGVNRADQGSSATPVTLRRFIGSPFARGAGLASIAVLAVYVALSYRTQRAAQTDDARRTLAGFVDDRAARIKAAQAARRKTMLFLADVPPVQGLVHAVSTGTDPRDGSSRGSWALRMQQILRAHMASSPEVYQARFIGVADGGRELVRVERRGSDIVVVADADLQAQGNSAYMQQTLRLQAGEVWVSDLDLNRANDKLELPHRPTLRYATPVYESSGRVFGIMIVNVDVGERLSEAGAATPPGAVLYVTNASGDFLLHPEPGRSFGFDVGQRHLWEDEFKPAELPHAPSRGQELDRLQTWWGLLGPVVAATALVSPNATSTGTLRYTASMPLARLEAAAWRGTAQDLVLPLSAGAVAWLLLYLYWASVQRQLQVRGQRLRLAAIVDLSMDAIVGLDAQSLVTSWNRGAVQLFGVEEGDALGQPFRDLCGSPVDACRLFDTDGHGTDSRAEEFDARGRDGRRLKVAMRVSRLGAESDADYSAIIRDITDERAAQAQIVALNRGLENQVQERTATLAMERQRLDYILRGTRVGTWEWDVSTGAMVVNERWAEIIGDCTDELMPISIDTLADRVHPEDLQKSRELLERHFAGTEEYYAVEIRMRHRNGHWVWVLSRGQLTTRRPDGAPEWMYGTHQDITAIKEAELEVERVAGLLASVLRAATELAIIATDPQGTITLFNAGAEQLLGYRAQELVGVSSPAPLHLPAEVIERGAELSSTYGLQIQGFRAFVYMAELEGAEQREWTYVRKDGTTVPVSLVVTTIRDEGGGIAGYLGIAQDITERQRSESVLRLARAAAEAASAAKSMFLANMSHEIRTPMNAVIGVAHLLESTPLDDDQHQLLSKLQIAGRSLLGIINDVLDLSKIEAGEMSVEAVAMDPAQLLHELEQMFGAQAQAKGITLELHGLDALPPLLMADELRLRQILVNLISNAIKFTAQGGVSIVVEREEVEQHQVWLRWRVRDTGVGIAADAQEKLFDPFVQADASTTRRFGGTGLGLSIVRKLAGLMGGRVGVDSEPGRGSEFWLRVPMREPTDLEAEAYDGGASGLVVVVVDDRPDDRRILAGMCRSLGWRALELGSGEALAAYCKRVLETGQTPPDALLVDWDMPGLDGLQTLQQVSARFGQQSMPATLMISAHERSAIAALDHQHLVDQILTKPVGPSELFNAVNHSVSRHSGNTDLVARSTRIDAIDAQWLVGVQVLVVDDSDINLEVARRLLERDGAIVATAVNGAQAVELLQSEPARFDAVLMDVQMPEMDGYEATRLIRGALGLVRLPVLALTAGALGEERRQAAAAGMNDFLTKPLDPQALVRALRRAVEAARGQPLQLVLSAQLAAPQPAAAPLDWPRIDGIDDNEVTCRIGHDADLFLGMLGRLLREFGSPRFAGQQPAEGGDSREALTARLHKLRGSAGLLGAQEVHRLAGDAENALRAGASIPDLRPGLISLDQALTRLEEAARPVMENRQAVRLAGDSSSRDALALADDALAELLTLLRGQDLSACERFHELAPALAARWGNALMNAVRQAVNDLDFSAAAQLIEHAPTVASVPRPEM